MLTDIFSSFDPAINTLTTTLSQHTLWLTILLSVICLTITFWVTSSPLIWTSLTLNHFILTQANETYNRHVNGIRIIISSLFLFLITANILGLLPYIFSLTRHILYTASLGLPLWLTYISSSYALRPQGSLGILLPSGSPQWLSPFLSLVETIRTFSRPITLSFRLAANITAGHIILILLGSYRAAAFFNRFTTTSLLVLTLTGYLVFEIAICLIQAYIFCLLLSLYANDHYKPAL